MKDTEDMVDLEDLEDPVGSEEVHTNLLHLIVVVVHFLEAVEASEAVVVLPAVEAPAEDFNVIEG